MPQMSGKPQKFGFFVFFQNVPKGPWGPWGALGAPWGAPYLLYFPYPGLLRCGARLGGFSSQQAPQVGPVGGGSQITLAPMLANHFLELIKGSS